jgi:hypothetical protein
MTRPAIAAPVALLLAVVAPWAAQAQAPRPQAGAAATPPTSALEENRREVLQLADAFGIPRQLEAIIRQARAEMIRATIAASGKDEQGAAAIVDEIMMPNFQARIQELVAVLIEPYATHFTQSDLKSLRAFYASPLGQKLQRVQPQAEAQANEAGLAWGQRVFQDSVDRHADELRARGLKF